MRSSTPLQWIEQAEARQVLVTAMSERAGAPSWCCAAQAAARQWLPQLRSWFVPPVGNWHARQMQPALVRRPVRPQPPARDFRNSCRW